MARPLTVASKRALVIIGLVFGCLVLVADAGLQRAIDDVDGPSAAQVATLWLDDPVVDDLVAQVYRFDVDAPDAREERLLWQTRAAESESDRPYWWSQLALRQLETGDRAGAVESLKRAYELQPYNVRTVEAEILMLIQDGDEAALAAALDRACELTPSRCDLDAAQLIEEFRTAVTAPDT